MKLFLELLSTLVMKSNHVGALRPCINSWLGQGRGEDGGQTVSKCCSKHVVFATSILRGSWFFSGQAQAHAQNH
jgi:hypothetical protein